MKKLMTGNEAVARGAYEAGVAFAAAYPGTPSTEILENIGDYEGIKAQWDPNEKVALESAVGASIAGARSLAAMKMVGVNVAADPLFSYAYAGVNGGCLLISADDPGMASSQNEQDNRWYAKFAKIPMVEPSNSQEAKDMVKAAMEISEQFDSVVLMRMTTRVCHSKTLVNEGEVMAQVKKPYVKNKGKYDLVPAVSRQLRVNLEARLKKLADFAETTALNYVEWNDKRIGVVASGIGYQYAKEVFGDSVSYFKLGFTHPLPINKLKTFAAQVETVYVVEELEPYLEEQLHAAGIACVGKDKLPKWGELSPDIIAKAFLGKENAVTAYNKALVVDRPPTLCAGCPHRSFFYELAKRKNTMISSDIGCYGLGGAEPLNAKDTCICMGGGPSIGHGAQTVFNHFGEDMRVVSVVGDSTFLHTGMNSLLTSVYNKSNVIHCILDNRITGMTGHQENPASGFTLQGEPAKLVDIPELCKALGAEHIKVVNPMDLEELQEAFDWAYTLTEPSVIITRWPCALKKLTAADKTEFGDYKGLCVVDEAACIGCNLCLKTGCPALRFNKAAKKVVIDKGQCAGCAVCAQVCPKKAIAEVGV